MGLLSAIHTPSTSRLRKQIRILLSRSLSSGQSSKKITEFLKYFSDLNGASCLSRYNLS